MFVQLLVIFHSYVKLPEGSVSTVCAQIAWKARHGPAVFWTRPGPVPESEASEVDDRHGIGCFKASNWVGYGYGSIPINTIFSGMNIHTSQLFWGSLGTRVLTHCHMSWKLWMGQSQCPKQLLEIGMVYRNHGKWWWLGDGFMKLGESYIHKHMPCSIRWYLQSQSVSQAPQVV